MTLWHVFDCGRAIGVAATFRSPEWVARFLAVFLSWVTGSFYDYDRAA